MKFVFIFNTQTDEQSSCRRKVRYGHETTALKASERMAAKYDKKYDVYECCYCDGWHIATALEDE